MALTRLLASTFPTTVLLTTAAVVLSTTPLRAATTVVRDRDTTSLRRTNPTAQLPIANATPISTQLLNEINRVRSNPQRYALWLESLRRYYDGTTLNLPGEAPIETQEGVAALDDAIAQLRSQRPVLPLTTAPELNALAESALQRPTAGLPTSRVQVNRPVIWTVMDLIVGDGDAGRRDRQQLLSLAYRSLGIACADTAQACLVSYSETVTTPSQPVAVTPLPPTTIATPIEVEPPERVTPSAPEAPAETVTEPPASLPPEEIAIAQPPETPPTPAEILTPETPEMPSVPAETTTPPPEPPTATNPSKPPNAEPVQVAILLEPDPASEAAGYLMLRRGRLDDSDYRYDDGSAYDEHLFEGVAGQEITINLRSQDFDTFLALFNADGQEVLAQNDDSGVDSNSQIQITLPYSGLYRLFVNGYGASDLGDYTLTID